MQVYKTTVWLVGMSLALTYMINPANGRFGLQLLPKALYCSWNFQGRSRYIIRVGWFLQKLKKSFDCKNSWFSKTGILNPYTTFLGQIGSQNFSSLISTWNNMICLKLLVCKGAFLIEAKQLFFCEVNFVYIFTNGTIFLLANEW